MPTKEEMIAEMQAANFKPVAPVQNREAMVAEMQASGFKPQGEEDAWYEDLGAGVKASVYGTGYGIKDLLGQMTDEDREKMADIQEEAAGGWGTTGRVLGELAQLAIPAGAVGKLAKGASFLKNASKAKKAAALIGGEAALGSGYGGLRLPGEDETRAENALTEGALNVAGLGAGKLLGKAVQGATKSDAAKQLISEGVELTPGQSASGVPLAMEELLSVFPLSSSRVKKMREIGDVDLTNNLLNKANPEGFEPITGIGPKAVTKLKSNVKSGYEDAWSGAKKGANKEDLQNTIEWLESIKTDLGTDEVAVVERLRKEFANQIDNPSVEGLMAIDRKLSKELKLAGSGEPSSSKYVLMEKVEDARKRLRRSLPTDVQDKLKVMDKNYRKYLIAQKASDAAGINEIEGNTTTQQLFSAMKSYSPRGEIGRGEADLYDLMRQGRETVDQSKIGGVLDRFRRVMQMAPTIPGMGVSTEGLLNATVGDTALQKGLQAIGDNKYTGTAVSNALRNARRLPVTLNEEDY